LTRPINTLQKKMNIASVMQNYQARISLSGRFDFNSHREFKQACEGTLTEPSVVEVVVDMAEVDAIDSSALGMLLVLRHRGSAANKRIIIENCATPVNEVLRLANFQQLFTMR